MTTTTTMMVMMMSITMTLTITTLAVQYSVLYIRTNYVRPHRMHIVHAAYCYRSSSVVSVCVCVSECPCVSHDREFCGNG